jgi:serralysin
MAAKKKLSGTNTSPTSTSLAAGADAYLEPLLWLTPLVEGLNPFGGSRDIPTTIEFTFLASRPLPYDLHDPVSVVDKIVATNWNNTSRGEQAAIQTALNAWERVANIDFIYTSTPANADFTFLATNETGMRNFWSGERGVLGFSELPYDYGPNYGHDPDPLYSAGYAVFNQEGYGWTANGLKPGGYGYVTIIHEIGHLLGLDHPWNEGGFYVDGQYKPLGPEPYFPGATRSNSFGTNGLNQGIFTTMSYNDGWNGQASKSIDWGYQKGPGAFDIAAIQELYGVNTQTNARSTLYELPTVNKSGTGWETIWDGDRDTIDANIEDTISVPTGGGSATIDLRAATLDPIDGQGAGGYVSWIKGIAGGFTIAHGVIIENAIGGAGKDRIIGNSADNEITGGGGLDTMTGGLGDDTFIFLSVADSRAGAKARDVITDFGPEDLIDLSFDLNGNPGDGVQSFHWADTFTGSAGDLRFTDGLLAGDTNGDRRADFEVALTGVTTAMWDKGDVILA